MNFKWININNYLKKQLYFLANNQDDYVSINHEMAQLLNNFLTANLTTEQHYQI